MVSSAVGMEIPNAARRVDTMAVWRGRGSRKNDTSSSFCGPTSGTAGSIPPCTASSNATRAQSHQLIGSPREQT